jgi:ribosomal protein S18 acetylase RimI-like enzyme
VARIALHGEMRTPAGLLFRLREERVGDELFLQQLFEESRPLAAQLAHLPATLRAPLLHGQYQAQRQGFTAQFPAARWLVILAGEGPAGRLVYDDGTAMLHIADLALLPAWRGQGIGTALLLTLAAAVAPLPLALSVAEENLQARRLYARLGFSLTGRQPGYLHLVRSAGKAG